MSILTAAMARPRFSRLADWLSWQERLHPSAIDLGLERLWRTLDRLGWTPPTCPVITVGGTNGKGSTVALLSRILAEAGYRVGTFMSPHLVRYNERIKLDGREISDASLMAAFERIDEARGADTLTFFEFNTLAALLAFETAGLDAIVLEVGMGGRLDAVNLLDADLAIVTSIGLDHCEWLGPDREAIGREKAGIFRAGRPAVFGSRDMPESIEQCARELGADLQRLGAQFDWSCDGERWTWRGRERSYHDLPLPALQGQFQLDNASAVLAALDALSTILPVERADIERGLEEVRLPGRFQTISETAPKRLEWVLDVAHNPAAATTLASQLAARPTSGRTLAVCGILSDKDIEGITAAMREVIDEWIVVGLDSPRALKPEELAERLRRADLTITAAELDVASGCRAARSLARDGDRLVVFGSFLCVGPALEALAAG